ncbi:MAG: pilus assembly protein PilM [Planctomycetota bacterium]
MAMKLVRGRTLPIGVDLGSRSVKMAQLRCVEETYELLAAAAIEVPDVPGAANGARPGMADHLREALRAAPFKGTQCILSLPAEATFVYPVRLAKLPVAQIDPAIRAELASKLPFPAAQAIIRHVVAGDIYGDGDPRQEVIAVAASRATLESYLAAARKARLDVVGVNIEPCAIVECFSRLFRRASDQGRAILFLDIGYTTTQVVLAHGGRIVFAKNLIFGDKDMDHAVAEGMSIPPEQAHALRKDLRADTAIGSAADEVFRLLAGTVDSLAAELMSCLRYYESVFTNKPVETAIFLGGGACDKRFCQNVAQRLNLPAQIGDPLLRIERAEGAGLSIGLDRRDAQPAWAVAIGLSLGAASAA